MNFKCQFHFPLQKESDNYVFLLPVPSMKAKCSIYHNLYWYFNVAVDDDNYP